MPTARPDPLCVRFAGAQVLRPDGLAEGDLSIAGGRIADGDGLRVAAHDYLILPGIVDLHGDGFERHLAPRRGAQQDPIDGLVATEAELAASGITTAMLAQFYSWEGGMRGPDFAIAVARALKDFACLTDMRMQLRVEIGLHDHYDRIVDLVQQTGIDYVVLNDHLAHDLLAQGKRPKRLIGQALKSGRSPEAHLAILMKMHKEMPLIEAALPSFTKALRALGVRLGSHDDATSDARARYRALGADVAEFPETRAAADAAKVAGEPVIMGAPNVVRGGSHDGKVAAADLIEAGLVDALVSDYHYASLARAALRLWDNGLPLEAAWGLISDGPARVMGWADRGELAEAKRADLVVMHRDTRRIEATICAGHATYLSGGFAARMIGAASCG